jgi:GT2 family glycosyltransferase
MLRSPHADASALTVSVVIPVWNGREHLAACLAALGASLRKPDQIVVVDDSSEDDSAAIARSHSCKVVSISGGPRGPATARNCGVAASSGDIVVFVDSDVVVHVDTLFRIEQQFLGDADLCAVFGSYDDAPTARGIISGYRNLLHHHVHQQSKREASTFWAGCGAIRREAFLAADGFDETYRWASIEDIELGLRLHRAGRRLLLCPEIQATHRKRWSFWQVIHTDVFRRAIPWTKLLFNQSSLPNDLNLRVENRVSAIAVWLLALFLILGMTKPSLLAAALIPLAVLLTCNRGLYSLFLDGRGFFFSLGAIGLHWLHYLYTSATFVIVVFGSVWRSASSARELRPAPRALVVSD